MGWPTLENLNLSLLLKCCSFMKRHVKSWKVEQKLILFMDCSISVQLGYQYKTKCIAWLRYRITGIVHERKCSRILQIVEYLQIFSCWIFIDLLQFRDEGLAGKTVQWLLWSPVDFCKRSSVNQVCRHNLVWRSCPFAKVSLVAAPD